MKKRIFCLLAIPFLFSSTYGSASKSIEEKNISFVKEMFQQYLNKRDLSKFDHYFSKDFNLEMNGKKYSRLQFYDLEKKYFEELKDITTQYKDIFAKSNRVVGRVVFSTTYKNNKKEVYEDIFIMEVKNNKISQIWEVYAPADK